MAHHRLAFGELNCILDWQNLEVFIGLWSVLVGTYMGIEISMKLEGC